MSSDDEGDFVSDEAPEDVEEVALEDIITVFEKKKWKARWCLLCNGVLLLKGKQEDTSSKKDILLAGCEIKVSEPVHKKDFVFSITTPYEELLFSVVSEKKLNQWLEKLNEVKDKEVTVQTKKRKQGKLMRISKSVGGKVATSAAGKKIIKDMIGKDGVKVITIVKNVIADLYDKNKAKEIENDIIRIGVKFILLFRNEDITIDDLNTLKPRVQKLWQLSQDYAYIINFDYNRENIQNAGNLVFELLRNVLGPHITEKNMTKLNDIHGFLFSEKVLDHLFKAEPMKQQRRDLAEILERNYNF